MTSARTLLPLTFLCALFPFSATAQTSPAPPATRPAYAAPDNRPYRLKLGSPFTDLNNPHCGIYLATLQKLTVDSRTHAIVQGQATLQITSALRGQSAGTVTLPCMFFDPDTTGTESAYITPPTRDWPNLNQLPPNAPLLIVLDTSTPTPTLRAIRPLRAADDPIIKDYQTMIALADPKTASLSAALLQAAGDHPHDALVIYLLQACPNINQDDATAVALALVPAYAANPPLNSTGQLLALLQKPLQRAATPQAQKAQIFTALATLLSFKNAAAESAFLALRTLSTTTPAIISDLSPQDRQALAQSIAAFAQSTPPYADESKKIIAWLNPPPR